jgi:dipeptidyl aminopeptidase/acylaminoacyl peptidase
MDLRISPDGKLVSFLAPSDRDVMNVWIEDQSSGEPRMVTDDTHRGIWEYEWAHDGEHVLYVRDRDGDENWHLFATSVRTGMTRDLTPFDGIAAQNLMTSHTQPHHVLVALNKDDQTRFDVYRIDLRTGDLDFEVRSPGDVQHWLADGELHVRAASALDPETSDTLLRTRDSNGGLWRDVVRWSFEETGSVLYRKLLAFTPDGDHIIVQSPKGTNTTHLALMDVRSGEEVERIAHDERCDIGNFWWEPVVLFAPDRSRVQAVMFDPGIPGWRVLDESVRADFEALANLDRGVFTIDDRDADDETWIVTFRSDVHPGRTWRYDRSTRTGTLVFDSNPALADYTLAPTQSFTYTARDGRMIPAYLTLPVGIEAKSIPLVVHPHGGPWARDRWGYAPWVQMFANRGYAVLQMNFRGSTGFGRDHINAGNGEWGVGAMQHDITDGVRWAIAEGIADPSRIAIAGGSYGGYATFAGVAFTPELYRCAVSVVGPSSVATLFESFPPTWAARKRRWELRVGAVESDPAANARISPLHHAGAVVAPMLIAHGANDPRVKLVESERMAAALRERGIPIEFVVYPDEGHGLNRTENNLDLDGRVDRFLARYLGGPHQPFMDVEGTSAEVRIDTSMNGER